jgi:hypothetical protein
MGWGLLHLTNSYFVFFPSLKFFHFVLDFLPSSISESDMRERFLQLVFLNPTERVRFDFVTEPEDQLGEGERRASIPSRPRLYIERRTSRPKC